MEDHVFRERQSRISKFAKELKENATMAENKMKGILTSIGYNKNSKKRKIQFQKGFIWRQCIVDFYLPKNKLCIEVDGGYHLTEFQKERDKKKDEYLENIKGLRVIRFTNDEVFNDVEKVVFILKLITRYKKLSRIEIDKLIMEVDNNPLDRFIRIQKKLKNEWEEANKTSKYRVPYYIRNPNTEHLMKEFIDQIQLMKRESIEELINKLKSKNPNWQYSKEMLSSDIRWKELIEQ